MEYKVIVSDAALIGFEEILEFIRRDNPPAAEQFGNALLNHVSLLATFPHIGAPVPRRPGLRKLLHTPIPIYYRVHDDRKVVEIIQFRHGSRRQPKFL